MPDNEQEIYRENPMLVRPVEALPPVIPQPEIEEPKSDIDDLFEVPQPEDNDIRTDHLVAAPEEDDLSDLTDPPEEEELSDLFTGEQPAEEPEQVQRPPVRRFIRTNRRYPPPPTSVQGVGY